MVSAEVREFPAVAPACARCVRSHDARFAQAGQEADIGEQRPGREPRAQPALPQVVRAPLNFTNNLLQHKKDNNQPKHKMMLKLGNWE